MNRLVAESVRRLERLERADTRRHFFDRRGVDFCTNDTLGLRRDPRVLAAARAALEEYGAGAGAAQLLGGRFPVHEQLEAEFRDLTGHEAALCFASGYHANVGVLQTLATDGWTILSDAHNHASLIDGCRAARGRVEVVRHNDVAAFAGAIRDERTLVVTESVFSMGGDRAPLDALARLPAPLVVDEAHAVGLFPPARGATVSIFPCGKALAGAGAVVCAPAPVVELLRSACRTFLFTTAPPPPVAAAVLAALRIARAEPERAARALELARRIDADAVSPIILVACRDNAHALARQERLRERGLDVRAVRPPTVARAALRISVHADRTDEEIDALRRALEESA